MANQDAIQDNNQFTALIAHSGTAGTAETRRLTSSGTPGALDVHIVGTAVDISGAAAGTNVNIVTGTQQTLGTVGRVGTVLGIGGTVSVTGGGGGIEYEEGTAPGTITLKAVGYEDAGGTLRVPSPTNQLPVTFSGTSMTQMVAGTLNVGTVTVANPTGTTVAIGSQLPAGTLNIGDIDVLTLPNTPGGTLGLVTRVGNIGTIESGTVTTTMGDLTGGTIDLGTVVGADASAGTSTTRPIQVGGTTVTGTVYGMLVDTAGNPQVDVVAIPQISVGTLPTLNLTTGTITTGSLSNVAMLHAGTIANVGTIPGVGVVTSITNLAGGTVSNNLLPLGGVVLSTSVAIGTTATAIPASALASRKSLIGYNSGTATVYLGGTGVTSGTATTMGIPVGTGAWMPGIDLGTTILYGIGATVGGTINVMEVS